MIQLCLGHEETSGCKDGAPGKAKLYSLVFSSFPEFTVYITENLSDFQKTLLVSTITFVLRFYVKK